MSEQRQPKMDDSDDYYDDDDYGQGKDGCA